MSNSNDGYPIKRKYFKVSQKFENDAQDALAKIAAKGDSKNLEYNPAVPPYSPPPPLNQVGRWRFEKKTDRKGRIR
jgi:hypothetical protein